MKTLTHRSDLRPPRPVPRYRRPGPAFLAAVGAVLTVVAGGPAPAGATATAPDPRPTCHGLAATIVGTPGVDYLAGTDGPDVIVTLGGNDVVLGGGGRDHICTGSGSDTVDAEGGDDIVDGGPGADKIWTGTGDQDTVEGGAGPDRIVVMSPHSFVLAGPGADRITVWSAAGDAHVAGGPGDDRITGSDHDDVLIGEAGDDTIKGRGGRDDIDGDAGQDTLDGGPGRDRLDGGTGALDFLLGGDGNDRLRGGGADATYFGGPGVDDIRGGDERANIEGGPGADKLWGGQGADVIVGDTGADVLVGSGGDDRLYGDEDADKCVGGLGNDLCDGGAPGPDDNTPEDVDLCEADRMVSCRAEAPEPAEHAGAAHGTVTVDGVTETWSVSVPAMTHNPGAASSKVLDQYDASDLTYTWELDGERYGCHWSASGSLRGFAVMTWWTEGPTYELQLGVDDDEWRDVDVSCPDQPTYETSYPALQAQFGFSGRLPLPTSDHYTGSRTYSLQEGHLAEWTWDFS